MNIQLNCYILTYLQQTKMKIFGNLFVNCTLMIFDKMFISSFNADNSFGSSNNRNKG